MSTHYLVVANQSLGGRHLVETVVGHAREGAEIHVTVPATPLPAGSAGEETAEAVAQQRLDEELRRLAEAGVEATGNVGPADPIDAIREQLARSHCTGLVISTLPRSVSKWFKMDLPHRAMREFGLPVEWLEARDDADEPSVVHIGLPASAAGNANIARQDLPPMMNR